LSSGFPQRGWGAYVSAEHVYQIETTALSHVEAGPGQAAVFATGNIVDVTNPLARTTVASGVKITLLVTDKGEPPRPGVAAPDTVAITATDAVGGLWFSNAWSGTQTAQQTIGGGNLSVR
jgi:hypothetical protein